MNWDDLRYFLSLARAKTVSGAGQELGVKHTTVARRIKALEQALGSRLFDRLPNGYAMTHAGEKLYEHALIMEEQSLELSREIVGLDTQLQGSLKLTAAHDVLTRLVIPHLGLFKRAYPKIELQLSSSTNLVNIGTKEADIALRLTPKPPDYLIGKKVLTLGMGLYASSKYLKKNPEIDQLILWSLKDKQSEWVKQHFPKAEINILVNDVTTMAACAAQHMGIARLPCYIADSYPTLRRLSLEMKPSTWGVWILSHVDMRETARVRACREFLINIIEQQKPLIFGTESRFG